ncbi:uncharacterized protein LOC134205008 isoform X2 [Armigeres subalbatus]|uniref:uncharacterized protein LOC134205008 isoform X2 n=1 Tax=Armigeres subalbatus TaxID=124917 RepID=UPI002ED5193C
MLSTIHKASMFRQELESPPFCAVPGCNTSYVDKYTIFEFPDCEEAAKLWNQALGLTHQGNQMQGEGVCELHFDEAFIIRDSSKTRATLIPGANPKNQSKPVIRKSTLVSNNHCRMCGLTIKYYMQHTVPELQAIQRLKPVLEMCLELHDSMHQLLPVTVCDGCANMVRFIGEFAETCWNAQLKLQQRYTGKDSRKVEPWNRVYHYVEHEVNHTEVVHESSSSEHTLNSQQNFENSGELITGDVDMVEIAHVGEETVELLTEEHTENLVEDSTELLPLEPTKNLAEENIINPLEVPAEKPTEIVVEAPSSDKEDTPQPALVLVKTEPMEKIVTGSSTFSGDETYEREFKRRYYPPAKKSRRSKEPIANINISINQSEKFTCKICLQQFNKQTELVIHNRKHVSEREQMDVKPNVLLGGWIIESIKCLQCRKSFPTPDELKAHTSQEHKCDAHCPICGMRFRNNEVLKQHRKRAKRCLIKESEPNKVS